MGDMFGEKTLAVLPGQFAEKVAGDNPQESDKYQYRIQDADTGEITERAEMRNPLLLWRIIDMYRYVFDCDISPCRKYEGFQFKFIFGGIIPFIDVHLLQWIQAVTGLCVLQLDSRFEGEPEVGEFIGESIFFRHIVRSKVARTYQQSIRLFFDSFDERRDIRSEVLLVRINGDGITEALCLCVAETMFQGYPFSPVGGVGDNLQVGFLAEYPGCFVR